MLNSIIDWCLNNRILVILCAIATMAMGYYCLKNTPVDAIPDIGEKQVIVYAEWLGRSPQDVEDQITYPLTASLNGVPGVKSIRSMSGFGFSMVFVIFSDRADYYWARSRVLERMNSASGKLPQGVVPTLGPDATALGQVFWYTLESNTADLAQLRSLQDWYIRYQLQAVEGVSEVASIGGYVKQYQIDVNPEKLRAHRVTLPEIYEAVRKSNIDVGAKVIENNGYEFFIRGIGFIKSIEDLEKVVIRQEGGTPILVKNVATVQIGPEFRRGTLNNAGNEAVGGIVLMRFGENPLEVLKRIKTKIVEIEPGLAITLADGTKSPVRIVSYYDRTDIIEEVMATLKENLLEEAVMVTVVVLIFLLHIRSSFIILPSLPLSIGISFIIMYFLGVDSNIMSLAGIAIAIGDVSDMGIIMTENIYRRISEEPQRPRQQVVSDAAKEVGPAMLTAVSNTIISFIPVFALTEAEGKLFKPLAYTKTFAIAASVILALTLVPVLAYYMLKPTQWSKGRSLVVGIIVGAFATMSMHLALASGLELSGKWQGLPTSIGVGIMVGALIFRMGRERLVPIEKNMISQSIIFVFRPILRVVLDYKACFLSIPIGLVILGLTIWLGVARIAYPVELCLKKAGVDPTTSPYWQKLSRIFPGLGREFMPPLDEGSLLYMPSLLPAASLSEAQLILARQNAAIQQVPEVKSVVGKLGRSESALDPAPISMLETIIILKEQNLWRMIKDSSGNHRLITKQEILNELQEKTSIPGVLPTWLQPIQTRLVMLQTGFRAMMGVKIFGSDPREIEKVGLQIEQILKRVPGATDVVADRIMGKPYMEFQINREAAARYGVNIQDIQDVIEVAIGGANITNSVEGRERYPIRIRYPRDLRNRFEDLEKVLVPTSSGTQVPISQIAKVNYNIGPQELKSESGFLVGYVTMNTRDQDEVTVVEKAEALLLAEKLRSDVLIAQGKPEEATLVIPPGYYWKWSGQFENQQRAMARLSLILPLVLLSMFVMLYIGFQRWWLALVVFFCILVSTSGGFAMLSWYGANLSVAVWVGFIALFGVADDASVVMLSFLEDKFKGRQVNSISEIRTIVIESSLLRIRPLLMTTATTVFGLLPIFLFYGRGSDVMQPMAIPSIGGMAVQVITFLIAPCIYCLIMELKFKHHLKMKMPDVSMNHQ